MNKVERNFVLPTLFASTDKRKKTSAFNPRMARPSKQVIRGCAETAGKMESWCGAALMEQVIRGRRGSPDKSPVHPGKFPSNLNPKKLNHGPALNIGFIRRGRFKSLLEYPESAASTLKLDLHG